MPFVEYYATLVCVSQFDLPLDTQRCFKGLSAETKQNSLDTKHSSAATKYYSATIKYASEEIG